MPAFETYWSGLADGTLSDAAAIGITDTAGNYTATDVEGALAELPSQYAPINVRPGNLAIFLGDSITSASETSSLLGASWPVYASIMSRQRIQIVRNAGAPGETTTQMMARFDTDVAAYSPQVVFMAGGTNDIGAGTALSTIQANFVSFVTECRAINARPVFCTVSPSGSASPTNRSQQIARLNQWILDYAAENYIDVVDFYAALVDATTGSFVTAYNSGDNIHPSEAGYAIMGATAATAMADVLPASKRPLCVSDTDDNNLVTSGCFSTATGTALVTPWVDQAGTPSGSAISYTTESGVPGKLLTITSTGTVAARQPGVAFNLGTTTMPATAAGATNFSISVNPFSRGTLFIGSGSTFEIAKVSSVSGSGPYSVTLTRGLAYAHDAGEQVVANGAVGDVFAYSGVVTNTGVAINAGVQCTGPGTQFRPMSSLSQDITGGVWYKEFTVPAATTALVATVTAGTGTGVSSFGQIGLYNLTRMTA